MKKNKLKLKLIQHAGTCTFAIGCSTLVGNSGAETTVGTANATVVAPLQVNVVTNKSVLVNEVTINSVLDRMAASTPLLRSQSSPPSGAAASTATERGPASPSSSAANSAAVNVTVSANGSVAVSGGGEGLGFTVSQLGDATGTGSDTILIEYN